MKKFKTIICLLMLLSVVITAIMLQFMPDIAPAHYNAAGEVDRLGSKYESFIFPVATVVLGGFFLLVDKLVPRSKNEKERKMEDVVIYISGVLTTLYFVGMNIFFMGKGIAYGHSGTASVPGIDMVQTNSVCTILIGAVLIILGNYMPKARVNALYGLRTKWSIANDRVWQKSQRFGGFSSVICGIVLILLGVFVRKWLLLWMLLIVTIWGITSVAMSYVFYRKDCATH